MWASRHLYLGAVVLGLLTAATVQEDDSVTFLFPTKGLTFYSNDTVNITYESSFSAPLLYTFCRETDGKTVSQKRIDHVGGFNASALVKLDFDYNSPCWFDLKPNSTGSGANSPGFTLLAEQQSQATVGLGSSISTPTSTSATATTSATNAGSSATRTNIVTNAASTSTAAPAASASGDSSSSGGLSVGGQAGIGVGAGIAGIGMCVLAAVLFKRRRGRDRGLQEKVDTALPPATPGSAASPSYYPASSHPGSNYNPESVYGSSLVSTSAVANDPTKYAGFPIQQQHVIHEMGYMPARQELDATQVVHELSSSKW
ncbi:hypothetical protein BJ170DRAFT_717551 [Xylariales sp. AK1849]|nr:hypothetical protein BJ170DRAFT_717551 [Xylariales sp. AK1849]